MAGKAHLPAGTWSGAQAWRGYSELQPLVSSIKLKFTSIRPMCLDGFREANHGHPSSPAHQASAAPCSPLLFRLALPGPCVVHAHTYRHRPALGRLWGCFQTAAMKQMSQQSQSRELVGFPVRIKVTFTLYCSLLSVQ